MGRTSSFAFSSTVCAGTGVDVDEDAVPVPPPLCAIRALGIITGFCGSASATGIGDVVLRNPLDPLEIETFHFTWDLYWAGTQYTHNAMLLEGEIRHADGGPTGRITGRMAIAPDPTAGSCTNATATQWIVEADMAFEIVAL